MDQPVKQPSSRLPDVSAPEGSSAETPDFGVAHPVLSRLMEEVRNEKRVDAAYDRVHHRHNRGR